MRDKEDVSALGRVCSGHDASRVEYANGEEYTNNGDCEMKQTIDEGH
jgi:hypothetical protein